jgi:hypothetical protein
MKLKVIFIGTFHHCAIPPLFRTFKQMMRWLAIVLIIVVPIGAAAQKKFFTFELAGSGGVASFNYEQSFYPGMDNNVWKDGIPDFESRSMQLYWRIGCSLAPVDKNNGIAIVLPVMIHGLFGKTPHYLDLGIGQTFSITTKGQPFILMPAALGYRFQHTERRYYMRLSYTPIISYLVDFQWQNWAGFTIGFELSGNAPHQSGTE